VTPGEPLDLQRPYGTCFYRSGQPERPLLLIGNGSGLAPLTGIARDALADGHVGPIRLYHGSRHPSGLYLREVLGAMAAKHANFHYVPCVSGTERPVGVRADRAERAALADHPELSDWRVFVCGYPPMVHAARQAANLAGAALGDIHADPFELRDLRARPRDQ